VDPHIEVGPTVALEKPRIQVRGDDSPGLANLAATVLQLLGFAAPEGYAPSLLASD